jgi:hypothetical protein
MIDVIHLRGTFEPVTIGSGVSGTFLGALDKAKFRPVLVPYEASYGSPQPYADSRIQGRMNAIDAIRNSPNPVVLAGFSQGAQIAGDLYAEILAGVNPEVKGLEVLGCALIADPSRPAGRWLGADPGGYGIAGERDPGGTTWWVAAAGDPITALPAGSPLRSVADFTAFFATDPRGWEKWGVTMANIAYARRFQRWWSLRDWRDWGDAAQYLKGFLLDGAHTDSYIVHGLTLRLADALNGMEAS